MKKIFIGSAWWAEHSQTLYQSTIVYDFFKENWYTIVNEPKNADIILLNGYPFDKYEEKIALMSIYYYLKTYKNKDIIVFGSIPDMIYWIKKLDKIKFISYSEFKKFDEEFKINKSIFDIEQWRIKFFIPLKIESISLWDLLHNKLWNNLTLETNYEITEYDLQITIDKILNNEYINNNIEEYSWEYNYMLDNIDNYYIETTHWCWFDCNYCAIKNVYWRTKSFPIKKIINNIKKWLNSWAKNIIIIDEDVWSYWIDIWSNFANLINVINKIEWDFKVKFYYLEPANLEKYYYLIDKTFFKKRLSYARITLQTTSQRILKLMNRDYNINNVLSIVKNIKNINKDVELGSIIIYWYPTETFEEFKDYFRLLKYFDCTDFLCYAAKEGTKAYFLPKNSYDDVLKKSAYILKIKSIYWNKIDPVIWTLKERKLILKTCY